MAYVIPIDQPLSETQAQLIAQMGSMKNLADLSFLKKFKSKFKKEDGMSLFDYLMKILKAFGIDPELVLRAFLNELFRTDKLVELILRAMAQLCTFAKIKLDSTNQYVVPSGTLSTDDKKKLTDINYNWLNSGIIKDGITTLVEALKTKLIQELMILIFGQPKKPGAGVQPDGQSGMVTDQARMDELIDEAVCGGDAIFSVSSPANIRNEDLEYNRLKRLEQVKNGNLTFQVTCQGVDISLPDDPMYLFRTAPPGFVGSEPVTPQEAMDNIFNFVGNQIQRGTSGGSSQSNSKSGSKSFVQKLIETLISSIGCLLKPFFVGVIGMIPGEAQGTAGAAFDIIQNGLFGSSDMPLPANFKNDFYPPSSCEIVKEYKKNDLSPEKKKKVSLLIILCNLILNIAIGFILAYVIEKVKKLIQKYIIKKAQEKLKRKIAKMKAKYEKKYGGDQKKKAQKSARQVKMMKVVMPALKAAANVVIPF